MSNPNPDSWVEHIAKRLQARANVDRCRELVAWCQSEGVYPDNYERLCDVAYQRDRQRKPRTTRNEQERAWRLKNKDKVNAAQRERRARARLLKSA